MEQVNHSCRTARPHNLEQVDHRVSHNPKDIAESFRYDKVEVIEERNGWKKVRIKDNGTVGWIQNVYIKNIAETAMLIEERAENIDFQIESAGIVDIPGTNKYKVYYTLKIINNNNVDAHTIKYSAGVTYDNGLESNLFNGIIGKDNIKANSYAKNYRESICYSAHGEKKPKHLKLKLLYPLYATLDDVSLELTYRQAIPYQLKTVTKDIYMY